MMMAALWVLKHFMLPDLTIGRDDEKSPTERVRRKVRCVSENSCDYLTFRRLRTASILRDRLSYFKLKPLRYLAGSRCDLLTCRK